MSGWRRYKFGPESGAVRCPPGCRLCCLDTEMPLTQTDVLRLVGRGYALEEFAEFRGGLLRLKNVGGRCVFLDEEGRCRVYPVRPTGCRAYPVVVDAGSGECVLDELCPAANTMEPEEFAEWCRLAREVVSSAIRG